MLKYFTRVICLMIIITVPLHAAEDEWAQAVNRITNGVVQVIAQSTKFNWLEPFKSPTQSGSAGSGFFIDKEGRMLTNCHVVNGALKILVFISALGHKQLEARIIGVCPDLDVALLELTPESKELVIAECGHINALEFGDSDSLYDTQRVLAVGYPLGIKTEKCTAGNVAGRDFFNGRSFVHITAPITNGNSGGPLVDNTGKVMGINTWLFNNAQNMNYIVPINEVLIILDELRKNRLVRIPELNIGTNRSTEAHARALQNPLPCGVYVNELFENSFEKRAGIHVGDMIYAVTLNGKQYTLDEYGYVKVPWRKKQKISVAELLSRCRVGEKIVITVYRQGTKIDLTVIFEHAQLNPVRHIFAECEPEEIDYEMFGGLVVMQLRENHLDILSGAQELNNLKVFRRYNDQEHKPKAALIITSVLGGSEAALSGCLQTGFILDTVNGQLVTTLPQLRAALMLSKASGEIAITTKDKYATVLDFRKVIETEPMLSRMFMFPITATMQELMKSELPARS